jgi:ABC-2 type transport system ATP-binding protein
MTAMIEAHGLTKTYPGDVRALDGISLRVEPGTVFGLLGPNGAGKSTTIKILTTLALPDGGSATVAGIDVLRRPERVRRVIGVVAQRAGVDPTATGWENLMLQGRVYGMRGMLLRRRVTELLERFGLGEAARRPVRTYSGGMQRRLDVALGLVHSPRVLFLDEPTTGLDPEVRAGMWREIARLSAHDGLTILLTTHYLEEADRLAHRLAIVDRGRVVATGTPQQLKAELEGEAIHLELGDGAVADQVRATLDDIAGVAELRVDGRLVHARVGVGASMLPTVLSALNEQGIVVASATIARPSLDDVYLRNTGRIYTGAGKEMR